MCFPATCVLWNTEASHLYRSSLNIGKHSRFTQGDMKCFHAEGPVQEK
jgi:hypothetical protein